MVQSFCNFVESVVWENIYLTKHEDLLQNQPTSAEHYVKKIFSYNLYFWENIFHFSTMEVSSLEILRKFKDMKYCLLNLLATILLMSKQYIQLNPIKWSFFSRLNVKFRLSTNKATKSFHIGLLFISWQDAISGCILFKALGQICYCVLYEVT